MNKSVPEVIITGPSQVLFSPNIFWCIGFLRSDSQPFFNMKIKTRPDRAVGKIKRSDSSINCSILAVYQIFVLICRDWPWVTGFARLSCAKIE